jgi:PAS domain S-box-containing protein
MQLPVAMRRFPQALILASIPIILVIVNHMLDREFANVRALAEEVERVHQIRQHLKTVLSIHQDIEAGQRGYVLTGDSAFLIPYAAAEQNLVVEFKVLQALVARDRSLGMSLPALHLLSQRRRAFAREAVQLTRQGRQQEAVRLIATRKGKYIMDAIRARIARIDTAAQQELQAKRDDQGGARLRTQRIAMALQSLLVIMLILAAWMTARSLRAERATARRFRDTSARHEAMFDAAMDGLAIHDGEGIVDSVNPALARMHDYQPAELIGRHVDMLIHEPPPRTQAMAELRRLAGAPQGSGARVREFVNCRKDGSTFPADVATSPVFLPDRTVFLVAMRDATERKRVEQMKTEFVSTVSHELRTPLTSIAGSLGLLSGGATGPLPEKAGRLIKIAHTNSQRLVRLINDILDIEKIESGKMTFNLTWVRLLPLLDQAVQANRAFAAGYDVELELGPVPDDAVVIADEDRLMQVVTNLLSNAAKFSPAGETVRITVTPMGDRHRITVADRGSGIPEAFRDRIFGKFAQFDASDTRAKGGSGLGLNIVREIVTRLGGSVSFDSVAGDGTAFHVDLPAAQAEEGLRPAPVQHEASGLPLILHVDDDPDMLRVVASAFEGKAEVHSTPSVREGHAALRRHSFDAAILDVAMADGSGLDLLPLLRDGDPTPTVLFTVHDSTPAYEARVDAMLTKSRSTLDELVATVLGLVRPQETE